MLFRYSLHMCVPEARKDKAVERESKGKETGPESIFFLRCTPPYASKKRFLDTSKKKKGRDRFKVRSTACSSGPKDGCHAKTLEN